MMNASLGSGVTKRGMKMTRDEITHVLGPIDEQLMAELLTTSATAAELAEAQGWVSSDERLINEGRHLPIGRVADLIAILEEEAKGTALGDSREVNSTLPPGAGPRSPLAAHRSIHNRLPHHSRLHGNYARRGR